MSYLGDFTLFSVFPQNSQVISAYQMEGLFVFKNSLGKIQYLDGRLAELNWLYHYSVANCVITTRKL